MSTKEQIHQIAADPNSGKVLSAQMILAIRTGKDPVITIKGKKIRLKRSTQVSVKK